MSDEDKKIDPEIDEMIESTLIEADKAPEIPGEVVDEMIDDLQIPEPPMETRVASVGSEMAERIQSVFEGNSLDRNADLDAVRDDYLKQAKAVAPDMSTDALLDAFRSQIGEVVDGYHARAEQEEQAATDEQKKADIKRTMEDIAGADAHEAEAEKLRIRSKQILEKGSEIRAYAAQGLERGIEDLAKEASAVRDRYLEMVSAEGFEITDEAQKAELLNTFTQEVEAELQARLENGEITKEKVESLRQDMQGEVQKAVDENFSRFQERAGKAAPGEELDISDDDMDDVLGALG